MRRAHDPEGADPALPAGARRDTGARAVNVFIGAEGAGKTSLLEAIALLGAAAQGRVDAAALRARGGRPKWYRQVSSVEAWSEGASYRAVLRNPSGRGPWEFIAERMTEGEVEVASRDRQRGLVLLDRGRDEYIGVALGPKEGIVPAARPFLGRGALREFLSELERFVLYSPQPDELAGRVAEPGWGPPLGVHGGRLTEALAEASRDRGALGAARRGGGRVQVRRHGEPDLA